MSKLQELKNEITTYCGLDCTGCEFVESHHCGGCIATRGTPFHGECPVAKCAIEKGFSFCGECPDLPEFCGNETCNRKNEAGYFLCDSCEKTTCGKLHAYSYTDPKHGDNPRGARVQHCRQLMAALEHEKEQ